MTGNLNKREENYEIKYLRKVLGQVDKRICVPQSLDASSLRALLDDIEPVSVKQAARGRPRWLSLQSGVAYAAAFALIVALFYSMEIYKPDMIDGGMRIVDTKQPAPAIMVADVPDESDSEAQAQTYTLPDASESIEPETADSLLEAIIETPEPSASWAGELGVGGGGKSTLLLEQDNYEYRWRLNDASDPDYPGLVTFEVIEKDSQEFAAQIDISDMTYVERLFIYEDMLMLVGASDDGGVAAQIYYDPASPAQQLSLSQSGSLVDVRLYKDIVHIVSLSDELYEDDAPVALPHTDAGKTCVITAVNLSTLETSRKAFTGADGTVQLHNLNAYIHYTGKADDGSTANYIGQILLDGMNIELGTVS